MLLAILSCSTDYPAPINNHHVSHKMATPATAFTPPATKKWAAHPLGKTPACRRARSRSHVIAPRSCAEKPPSGTEQKPKQDFVERFFTGLFGPKEETPFGLKRFDRD
eukprot:IDg16479t1